MTHILDILPGIIWSGFLGLAIGNFATNPIYRLPRGKPLFTDDPYCDSCHVRLTPRDLFPVLSWLMSRGKCRTCGAPVPGAYTLTEMLICIIFIVCYLQHGFSEPFILISFGMTALVMLGMMLYLDDYFSHKTFVALLVCGMLYRTLINHTIYGFAGGAFIALVAGMAAWRVSRRPMVRDIVGAPPYLKMLVAAGVWLAPLQIAGVFLGAMLASLIRSQRQWMVEWVIMLLMLAFVFIRI